MLSTHQLSTDQSSTHRTSRSTVSRISPLWIIVIVWAASNLLLFALQGLGLGVGFHVHPLGEDREWVRLMAKYQGLEMCGQFLVDAGKPEPARTLVVSSVFAADIPPARRALPFAKARGPLPGNLCLPAGRQSKPCETSEFRFCVRRACAVLELFRIPGADHVDPVDSFRAFDAVRLLILKTGMASDSARVRSGLMSLSNRLESSRGIYSSR